MITKGPITLPLRVSKKGIVKFKLYLVCNEEQHYHVLLYGDVSSNEPVLMRIESACTYAHLYGSSLCDCKEQLEQSIFLIANEGRGVLVYALDQHGRGIGIEKHLDVYKQEQDFGLDTVAAHKSLGYPVDARKYEDIDKIIDNFKINKIKLLTNNPQRIEYFNKTYKLVERIPLETGLTKWNFAELKTKKEKLGHLYTYNFDDPKALPE